MDISSVVRLLEREWEIDSGFFGRLRSGEFEVAGLHRLLAVLEAIHLDDGEDVNRRLVSLLWFMPLFMEWQTERVQEQGGDGEALESAINQVEAHVMRLLGVP